MFKTLRNALKIEDIRKKLIFTFLMLVVVRFGSQLPIPGANRDYFQAWFAQQTGDAFNFFDAFTGGSFTSMSLFALGITPYITSSIIVQLLTIAIPKLEEMQKDGEDGRKKISSYTRYLTVALAVIQAIGITLSYRTMFVSSSKLMLICSVLTLVSGSTFIMWLAEQITNKGITNGSSMIIFVNIVSNLPTGITSLIYYAQGDNVSGIVKVAIVLILMLAVIIFIVVIHEGERRIPVQYSAKMVGRRSFGGKSTFMPIKVSTAGVLAIIFAISLVQFPETLSQFFTPGPTFQKVIEALKLTSPIGAVLYMVLIIFFAYFYTSITFNPLEVADNIKKQGGFIPGIRPGKPTSDYLTNILNYIIFIGAVGLIIVCVIPFIFNGVFGANVSFGGTSIIIVVGVILETVKQIESQLLVRNYKGFLNN